jgi:acetyl-CoA C-acetyltransferase
MKDAYIVAAVRAAGGKRGGRLKSWHPVDLAGSIIDALLDRLSVDPEMIDDVILGCVGQAGEQSTNIGRNAVLASRLPERVPGVSVDRQCGSSQQALHFAAQAVLSGMMDVVIAGGVESMSRAPMGLTQTLARDAGLGVYKSPRMEARYPDIVFNQFDGAETIARNFGFTREDMDRFGFESQRKAAAASASKRFDTEILPLTIVQDDGSTDIHRIDEGIRSGATLESTRAVRLVREGGLLTAATSSQICDGASGVLVCNDRGLKTLGVAPMARIHHLSVRGGNPVTMLDAPLEATRVALQRSGMSMDNIDLYEVNEAFASVPMAWLKSLHADPERLNVNGGAIALGHPLGASGTRLLTTLVYELRARGGRYGLQTMCEGGGLANVTIVENLETVAEGGHVDVNPMST